MWFGNEACVSGMNFVPLVVPEVLQKYLGMPGHKTESSPAFALSILLNEKESATIEVFDETGRRIHSQKSNTEVSKIEMNISGFSSGIYTVRVTQANRSTAQIFIKQ